MLEWKGNDIVTLSQKQVVGRDNEDPSVLSVKWNKMRRMIHLTKIYGRKNFLE